jgi:hypothetical protein
VWVGIITPCPQKNEERKETEHAGGDYYFEKLPWALV